MVSDSDGLFPTLMAENLVVAKLFAPTFWQNGPIEKFTALTASIFVLISVFVSQGPKVDADPVVAKLFAPKLGAEWSG